MATAPMKLSLELVFAAPAVGLGTEVPLKPSWLSQPPPRPRYQPSPAIAGVLRAAAATVAMASIRSFIFLPSLENIDRQEFPRQCRKNQCSAYNDEPGICLHMICCFAGGKRPLSKVLVGPCVTVATERQATDPKLHFSKLTAFHRR